MDSRLVLTCKRFPFISSHFLGLSAYFIYKHYRGPLVSPAARERVERLVGSVQKEGGIIHLDGRGLKVPGYENGNFVGPSLVEGTVTMEAYQLRFRYLLVPSLHHLTSLCFRLT